MEQYLEYISKSKKILQCNTPAVNTIQYTHPSPLFRYDPLDVRPQEAGYGAGSSCPNVMLAYLKHIWITGQRQEAYARWILTTTDPKP